MGSHLCERLLAQGHEVMCADNSCTGARANIVPLMNHPDSEMIRRDVCLPLYVEVDQIFNLACPASPIHCQNDPEQTVKMSVHGAINMLGLAKRLKFRNFRPSPVWSMGIQACNHNLRRIGAVLTRSVVAPATRKGSVAPRRSSSTATARTDWISGWRGTSIPTVRACTPVTGEPFRISSSRPCEARPLSSTEMVRRPACSVTQKISYGGSISSRRWTTAFRDP